MRPARHEFPRGVRTNFSRAIVLAVYLLLALVLTFPLVLHFTTHGPGHGVDDPSQTWSLWWLKFAIFNRGSSPLFSDYVFYPLGLNLVAYTPTFLHGVISLPLQFLFGVIVAQNLLVLFSLAVGGFGTFLFVQQVLAQIGIREDSKRTIAAALAGAVYAFGAWHLNYLVAGHFMLLSNEWLPFFALCLVRLNNGSWRAGALAGLFLVMATWTELTFAPFLTILTVLYVIYQAGRALTRGVSWRGLGIASGDRNAVISGASDRPRNDIRGLGVASHTPLAMTVHRGFFFSLITLGLVAGIGIAPLALNLLADMQRYGYYLTSGVGRIEVFSAEPISFFFPSAQHPLLGVWANSITNANTSYAFVGYAVLILAALGVIFYRRESAVRFWAVAALFFAVVMLGPTLLVGGQSTGIPLPFALFRFIPFVNANRYPVRFNAMLMLALTPLVALGAVYLLRTWRQGMTLAGLVVLLTFEQLVLPIPLADLRTPPVFQTIRDEPGDFAILDLPLGWRGSISLQGKMDDKAQFYQTVHQKRILGGVTSRLPQTKFQFFLEAPVINSLIALETGRDVDDARRAQDRAAAPAVLTFFNIRYVEVNRALTDPQVLDYARDVFPLTEIYRDDQRIVYRVAPLPIPASASAIDLRDETARLYFDDSWGRVQAAGDGSGYRWATRGDSKLWLPLARTDQQITFRLMGLHAGQMITVRVNGQVAANLSSVANSWVNYPIHVPAAMLHDGLNEFAFLTDTGPVSASRQDNYMIGDTGVTSPVDISATGAGYDAGRFGVIAVAGQNRIPDRRGYHLVAVDPRTGNVDQVGSFDTFADPAESTRLAQFVGQLPEGEIVAGVAVDEVSQKLQQSAADALAQLGVGSDLRFQFRVGHAFIGVKGAQPGQALEQVDGRLPANVSVGKNVTGENAAFALGGITIGQ